MEIKIFYFDREDNWKIPKKKVVIEIDDNEIVRLFRKLIRED